MDNTETLVVIGTGHAGVELAFAARQQGWAGAIVLLGEESHLPYHRPPLSKAFLCGTVDAASLALRQDTAFEKSDIALRLGCRVRAIDRAAHEVVLDDGTALAYTKLALCTGGRARALDVPGMEGGPPSNLHSLRTQTDALAIAGLVREGARVVIVGAGYVGLEVAASARKLGATVTVLESQARVLARVTGATLSAFYESVHREAGVDLRTNASVQAIERDASGAATAVLCGDGTRLPADVVIVGIGMLANTALAEAAGLRVEGGIVVDEHAVTSDPDIFSAGDCTVHDSALYGRRVRLESVPNALEQARAAAGWLCDKPRPNHAVPWFWSDQYDLKLQMTGLADGHDACVVRGSLVERSFCAFYLRAGRVIAVDAVNRPADFMLAKKAVAAGACADPQALADTSIALKDLLALASPSLG
ncbi:NAD(P)/FAD-dependent oxidoreductase [Hydrogenophaga sp.]|uniref:NAD(P)/FAD-dependent oxidoreductase n=1 Tax=Hydrogenophaga sp. TaxID=1904254 RepID=UPI0035628C98